MKIIIGLCTAAILIASGAFAQNEPADMQAAMAQLMKMSQQLQNASEESATEVIHFKVLKEKMPASSDAYKRTGNTGEKSSMMGMTVSSAEATFVSSDGEKFTVKITDMGGTGGFGAMASMGMAMGMGMERETDTGFERPFSKDGCNGREEYDSESRSGTITAMAAKRLTVAVDGDSLKSYESMKTLFDLIDLKGLLDLIAVATPIEE